MKLRQLDRRFLSRESEPEDIQVVRTEGCYVYDERGRRYLDFLAGWCVGNFGWGHREITKRPRRRRPDYLCMGKAITGGQAPMGATIVTRKVAKSVEDKIGFWSTYGWHPSSVDAAIATVGWLKRNAGKLMRHVDGVSASGGPYEIVREDEGAPLMGGP